MTGETMRARVPAGRTGFLGGVVAFVNALAGFLESRLALLTKESKSAVRQLLGVIVCVAGALLFVVMGYAFLIVGAVAGIARLLHVHWFWIALVAALIHFILVLGFVLGARGFISKAPFTELRAELKKDREWLRNLDEASRPNS